MKSSPRVRRLLAATPRRRAGVRPGPFLVATLAVVLAASAGGSAAASASGAAELRTRAEASGYMETSRYADVVAFLDAVVPQSPWLQRTAMGYTLEGRQIPLVVAGDVADASAAAVQASGKLRVYLQGNIHAGEVCGKEALLMLLRDIAAGRHDDWFDDVVLLIAPIYNADGNERIELTHRPGQNGPYGGMGQRPNAQGLDLNRDHMKLESPEARSLLGMMRDYDPQVSVDLHTTNGTRHAYHLTYSPPLNPNTDAAIDSLLRRDWLPTMTERVREHYGWEFYTYGNTPFRRDAEPGWYTFDHRPRFNNNYIGLRNRFAILSEAYAYASFEERVQASLYFVREIVTYAAERAGDIRAAVTAADAAALPGTELAVRATYQQSPAPVDILMGETDSQTHPLTGRRLLVRRDVRHVESMYEYSSFRATDSERVPAAYLVPAELTEVVDRLHAHGVRMQALSTPRSLGVERFRITSSEQAAREFQGHRERRLEGAYEQAQVEVPAGTWRIDMRQPLARLAFYLLEPRSDDGLADWNFMDDALEAGGDLYPVLRVPMGS